MNKISAKVEKKNMGRSKSEEKEYICRNFGKTCKPTTSEFLILKSETI